MLLVIDFEACLSPWSSLNGTPTGRLETRFYLVEKIRQGKGK